MASLSLQFHALPDEILDFSFNSARKYNLNLYVLAGHPSVPVMVRNLESLLQLYKEFLLLNSKFSFEVILLKDTILVANTSNYNIHQNYPNILILRIGEFKNDGLEESSVSFMSEDHDAYKVAKKIFSDLKRITLAGATATNAKGSAFYRKHRYTEEAKQLNSKGYKMHSLGNAVYTLGIKRL